MIVSLPGCKSDAKSKIPWAFHYFDADEVNLSAQGKRINGSTPPPVPLRVAQSDFLCETAQAEGTPSVLRDVETVA